MGEPTSIDRYSLSKIKCGNIIQLIGARGSGKTVLLYNLMASQQDKIDFWILMSPTKDTEDVWLESAPPMCILRHLDKDLLQKTLDYNDRIARRGKRRRRVAIVWDDIMFLENALKGPEVRQLYFNGRHVDVDFWNLSQYMMDMAPAFRNNTDIIFTFHDEVIENRVKLRKFFVGKYSQPVFDKVFALCTEGRKCMVVDRVNRTINWFLADPAVKPKRLCADSYWKLWERFGRQDWREFEDGCRESGADMSITLNSGAAASADAGRAAPRKREVSATALTLRDTQMPAEETGQAAQAAAAYDQAKDARI